MPYYMYVALQDDDKISVFTMDAGTGKLAPKAEVPVSGGPFLLAISRTGEFFMSAPRRSRDIQLPDKPQHRRTYAKRDGVARGHSRISVHRPQRQVFAVRLLSRRACGGTSD